MIRFVAPCLIVLFHQTFVAATPPVLSYLFPAGGQRGTTVTVRVGGLFLHDSCQFDFAGGSLKATQKLKPIPRIWFEGPLLPLPESQKSEDYPVDRSTSITIPVTASTAVHRPWIWTSQGAASGPRFVVGDLPEVVETEIDGDPIPVSVNLPVTVNGRIFPREDFDLWSFHARKDERISAFANTSIIRSPVTAHLEILNETGTVLAEQTTSCGVGQDAAVRFIAPRDARYTVRIRDSHNAGGPASVYRLTITKGPVVDSVFPLGARRGEKVKLRLTGQAISSPTFECSIPDDATERLTPEFPAANSFMLDVDDLPEYVSATDEVIDVPAALNGKAASSNEWCIRLKKGTKYDVQLLARSLDSPLCAVVVLRNSKGEEIKREVARNPNQDPAFAFSPTADDVYRVQITERFRKRGGPEFSYRLKIRSVDSLAPDFRLNLASVILNVPRGATGKVKVTAERQGPFRGPIELALHGLPDGLTAQSVIMKENQNSAELTITAARDAKVIPSTVSIVGKVEVDGKHLTRTAQSPDADRLIVTATVPTPFKFVGEYTMSNAPRGQPYSRKYELVRTMFDGPITIHLADRQIRHLQGVTAAPILVEPNQTTFEYAAQLPPWIEVGRTCRVTLMAVGQVVDADGTKHTVSYTSTEQNHQMIVVPEPGHLAVECERATLNVEPGRTVSLPIRIVRANGLTGDVTVQLVFPAHWRGVRADPIRIAKGQQQGELKIDFATGHPGPFNCPATLRATLGPVVAETSVELVLP